MTVNTSSFYVIKCITIHEIIVPENKRRVPTVKRIVIAIRNAGLNTIRLRRMIPGVGIKSLLPLYSPNVNEINVLDKKKVRREKLLLFYGQNESTQEIVAAAKRGMCE